MPFNRGRNPKVDYRCPNCGVIVEGPHQGQDATGMETFDGVKISDTSGDGAQCSNPECQERERAFTQQYEETLTRMHGPNWRRKLRDAGLDSDNV